MDQKNAVILVPYLKVIDNFSGILFRIAEG
jgi:hypothetical protein